MVYVINERLYKAVNGFVDAIKNSGIDTPYFTISDHGQRASWFWPRVGDTSHRSRISVFGVMDHTTLTLEVFEDQWYKTKKVFETSDHKGAVDFLLSL